MTLTYVKGVIIPIRLKGILTLRTALVDLLFPFPAPMTVIGMCMVQRRLRGWTVMPVIKSIWRHIITTSGGRDSMNLMEEVNNMAPTYRIM
jgi:hypothetical protein